MEIVELGQAGPDPDLVDEGDGVGQRESQPAAVLVAAASEEAAAATTAADPARLDRAPSAGAGAVSPRRLEEAGPRQAVAPCAPRAGKPNWARNWSSTACDGRFDLSGLVKSKPRRSVSLRELSKLTGRRSTLISCPDGRCADEALGKRGLDRRGDLDIRDRPGNRRVDIIGAQAKVGLLKRLPVAAELPHIAAIGLKVRIAAGDRVDQHRLARGEVEDARAGRIEHRIAELVDGRRPFLAREAGQQVQPVDRRPVGPGAELGQRAEIGQLIDLRIGVEGQVAERAELAIAARDRQVEVDRRLPAASATARLPSEPRRGCGCCRDGRCWPRAVSVVLASPAGSLNSLPLAVAVRSADAVVSRARSCGKAVLSRSVRVMSVRGRHCRSGSSATAPWCRR